MASKKSEKRELLHVPMTKARLHLGSLVRHLRVEGGIVVLEKDGVPVAGIMNLDELEDLIELNDPAMKRRLRQSARDFKAGRYVDARELLDELKPQAK